ncbi:unnamed protein product, partial [Ascophyllum nodosum]
SGDDRDAIHPAVIRADHLRMEVEEVRILRERDKQEFELMLAEAERTKGKLLRQVKFLSEEEEAARAELTRKQTDFLAETARLHKALINERKALAEATEDKGHATEREGLAFERKLEREAAARRAAEEKTEILESQADARRRELQELRNLVREGDEAKADLSREVAALRREVGGGTLAAVDSSSPAASSAASDSRSWDNPVARQLRAKITTLEKEARRREALVQGLQDDQRNAIALEDQVRTLQEKLKRSEGSLKEAIAKQAECAAIEDEKHEWSVVFEGAMREEGLQVQVEAEGASGRGGGRPFEGAAATRPSPLIALRLLARAQEERSLAVKELTAVRLRYEAESKRLGEAEKGLKKERERASSSEIRSEELQLEIEALQRRCRSAEQELTAQKELLESYEQDTFRKPAGEAWQSEYAKLEAALSAVKDEARALREASEGQVSAPEARRLRAQLAKAEAALEIAARERDQAIETVQELGEKLEGIEKGFANGSGTSKAKVLHMRANPSAIAAENARGDLRRQVEMLEEDNKRLLHQLETAGAGAIDTSVSTMEGGSFLGGSGMGVKKGETPDVKKFTARLQETYKERINFYRESVYLLTGYRIDMLKDPTRQVLRLRSMYAANESDVLLFQYTDAGLHLAETPLALQHKDKIDLFLEQCGSIPAFLSSLTLEWFEQQTAMPR